MENFKQVLLAIWTQKSHRYKSLTLSCEEEDWQLSNEISNAIISTIPKELNSLEKALYHNFLKP